VVGGFERRVGGGCQGSQGWATNDSGDHSGSNRWSQSRAPSAPMWRLGMQCEGLVRDPIRLAALVLMNQAGWPSSLGMEAEAPREPYSDVSVTDGRREKNGGGNAPTSGSQHGERPTGLRALRPFPFSLSPFRARDLVVA